MIKYNIVVSIDFGHRVFHSYFDLRILMQMLLIIFLCTNYLNPLNKMGYKTQINGAFGADEEIAVWTQSVHEIICLFVCLFVCFVITSVGS